MSENLVFRMLKKVPKGKVTTYGALAKATGLHPRQVAAILRKNYDVNIPCHRVVMSNGNLGGYNRGVRNKALLLGCEGITVKNSKVKNLRQYLFTNFL